MRRSSKSTRRKLNYDKIAEKINSGQTLVLSEVKEKVYYNAALGMWFLGNNPLFIEQKDLKEA